MNGKQLAALCVGGLLTLALWLAPSTSHGRVKAVQSASHFDYSFDYHFGPREFYISLVIVLSLVAVAALRSRRNKPLPPAALL